MWLFLAFVAVPLIEIALFIQVGGLIGLLPTLAVVLITAIIGTMLVRSQGAQALGNLQNSFSRLEDPTAPLAHGAMILLAGALLLTPGFFTDAFGFALLAPPFREAVLRYASKRVTVTRFNMGGMPPDGDVRREPHPRGPHGREDVIEGEYSEVQQDKRPNHPGSGWTKH
ncbi:membrane protein FxsA [Salipiger pallidus]|uniref:Membrane protein FxsA n=1 Tax=Salipiger pallidus TaxID=1775170 RepID=A0A8J2ZLZ7_9RHOB|nr:FxsA family protein [Salipiger pallidus]GGG78864.1 membrane protein FxsA [Salipiger pallidus]